MGRKGLLQTNHKHIFLPGKSVNIKLGTKHTSEKYKNKKCGKTASQRISECQKDHLAFQAFLRVGSTIDFTHAANQQPGMGSRKYEKATTLPTSVSTSRKFDKDHQISTKSGLGVSPQISSGSTVVGNSFWSRTTGVGKFGSHPSSSFLDFDDSVSDAWDIKDAKGINFGRSAGQGIVIDVQPTSVSPFSITKTSSIGPAVHGKHSANTNPPTTAKSINPSLVPEVTSKLEKAHISVEELNIDPPKSQNQEIIPSLVISDTIKGNTTAESTTDSYVSSTSPVHISTAVPSNISTPTSTTISLGLNSRATSSGKTELKKDSETLTGENKRYAKLENLINDCQSFEIEELRKLAWSGISSRARAKAWKILCGYLPPPGTASISPEENLNNASVLSSAKQLQPSSMRRRNQEEVVQRKQVEYRRYVEQYFTTRHDDDGNGDTYRQIHIDIPRMSPVVGLFQQRCVQEIFERILYIWAIRHPASGYVQGINDLVTPFFLVFLHDSMRIQSLPENTVPFEALFTAGVNNLDVEASLSKEQRDYVEADAYWCLTKVLDSIQDNYTFAQPGIQLKVKQLEDLTRRIDQELHEHLVGHDVEYIQFAFRWMNNLLMREIPVRATVRLWDTYLAQADGFSHFHLYVCAAFLCHWKSELMKKKDFHTLLMFLQNVPTAKWGDNEINLLVAEAYRLSYLFAGAPSHLSGSKALKS